MIILREASGKEADVIIHGMLSIPEPDVSPEYLGSISLKLPSDKNSGLVNYLKGAN